MAAMRQTLVSGGGAGRVTRRGFVLGALGLAASAVAGRPAFAAGLTRAPSGVVRAAPPLGFRLVMKGEVVGLFRQADGLTLPSSLEWDGLKDLKGDALKLIEGATEAFRGQGMKAWTLKDLLDADEDSKAGVNPKDDLEDAEESGGKIILRNGTKVDQALYAWYAEGRQVTRVPDQFVPKLPLGEPGVLGTTLGWQPAPITGTETSVPADLRVEPEPAPSVRNPLLFVFREGQAIARYRLVGATVKRLNPQEADDDGKVTLLTIVCKKLILTVRDS